MGLATNIAIRLVLCCGCAWLAWRLGGLVPMVATAPLFGLALARPLMDLVGAAYQQVRVVVWHSVEGRYFVYRDIPVQVLEDDDHRRWIRAADVRQIIGHTASVGALALSHGEGWCTIGKPAEPHFSDDALLVHLARQRGARALHFHHWVEREIAFPARCVRARHGLQRPGDKSAGTPPVGTKPGAPLSGREFEPSTPPAG